MLRLTLILSSLFVLTLSLTASATAASPKLCSVHGAVYYASSGNCGANLVIPDGSTLYVGAGGWVYSSGGLRSKPVVVAGDGSFDFFYRPATRPGSVVPGGGHINVTRQATDMIAGSY